MNYLIAGLGNPGKKYSGTRHNAGFMVLDHLTDLWRGSGFTESSHANALVSEVRIDGHKILLVKPQTFMNNSGDAVLALATYFDVMPEEILIAYDDVDLPLGRIRLAISRGSGGHRGVQSVINRLGTKDFMRLRIGISPVGESGVIDKQTVPEKGINPFVMSRFSHDEESELTTIYPDIKKAVTTWIEKGGELAMNQVN
jgi:PTH1 family peptidyl-tRNA hydrolase